MIDEINIQESLSIGKIKFIQSPYYKIGDLIINAVLIGLLPLMMIIYFFSDYDFTQDSIAGDIIGFSLSILFSLIVISGIKQSNRLKIIKGTSSSENKKSALSIISQNKWSLYKDNDDYMIVAPKNFRSQISLIFDNEKVYINAISFGFGGIISPFYSSKNNTLIDEFVKDFELLKKHDG